MDNSPQCSNYPVFVGVYAPQNPQPDHLQKGLEHKGVLSKLFTIKN